MFRKIPRSLSARNLVPRSTTSAVTNCAALRGITRALHHASIPTRSALLKLSQPTLNSGKAYILIVNLIFQFEVWQPAPNKLVKLNKWLGNFPQSLIYIYFLVLLLMSLSMIPIIYHQFSMLLKSKIKANVLCLRLHSILEKEQWEP